VTSLTEGDCETTEPHHTQRLIARTIGKLLKIVVESGVPVKEHLMATYMLSQGHWITPCQKNTWYF